MKILYLSHCDWAWARQRPQHLAAALAEYGHEVHVYYRPFLRRRDLCGRPTDDDARLAGLQAAPWLIPTRWASTSGLVLSVSRLGLRQVSHKYAPDVIWYSSPELEPVAVASGMPTVWDCMDLTAHMRGDDETWGARVRKLEHRACRSASAVIASSTVLQDAVADGADDRQKVFMVNNGYLSGMEWPAQPSSDRKMIGCYFGTVAEWFDFELILELLAAEPLLEFRIIGPVSVPIPSHPRLKFLGSVPHGELPLVTADVAFFMMPFRINRLIEAVDPVKLYEYIASGRPTLAPRYDGVTKFEPFVSLYDSHAECLGLAHELLWGEKHRMDAQARSTFLIANSWKERAREATRALEWAVR